MKRASLLLAAMLFISGIVLAQIPERPEGVVTGNVGDFAPPKKSDPKEGL